MNNWRRVFPSEHHFLKCLQGDSAWGAVEVVSDIRQEHLEGDGAARSGRHSFLQLNEQVIDEAMGVMGVITVSMD